MADKTRVCQNINLHTTLPLPNTMRGEGGYAIGRCFYTEAINIKGPKDAVYNDMARRKVLRCNVTTFHGYRTAIHSAGAAPVVTWDS